MPRIRKIIPGVDPKLLIKDAAKLLPDPTRRLFLRGGREPRRAHDADRLRHRRQRCRREACCARFPNSTTACRPGCSIPTSSRRPIRRARSPGRSRSTPIIRRTRRRRSTARTYKLEVGGLVDNKKSWTLEQLYALPQESQITRHICVEGWSAIGKWTGRAAVANSCSGSAPTRARNTSGSSAPRAIPTPSTWRPRCIRRRSSRSSSTTRSCRASTASR